MGILRVKQSFECRNQKGSSVDIRIEMIASPRKSEHLTVSSFANRRSLIVVVGPRLSVRIFECDKCQKLFSTLQVR